MLAFLHTARVHVETFDRLVRELDNTVPIRHEVREGLLADALAAGAITDAVRSGTTQAVQTLAREGATVIVCTCSTIGGLAEASTVPAGVVVMRIDRPMAEQAVASGRRIIVLAALRSTFEPTVGLLRQIAADLERPLELVEVLCEHAWRSFELGDHSAYAMQIAKTIEATAKQGDIIVLAQTSMASAAELVVGLGVPVLSSPLSGVQAAIARYRATAPP